MKIRSGHLLILIVVFLGYMVFEDHYNDAKDLISQALKPATERQQVRQTQPLGPSPESFYPSSPYRPSARYESDCWWKHAEDQTAQVEVLDPSRLRAATEAETGAPRLLELPVYRVDGQASFPRTFVDEMAPSAIEQVVFIDTNGRRWQPLSGTVLPMKGGVLTGEIVRENGRTYFHPMTSDHKACYGRWELISGQ